MNTILLTIITDLGDTGLLFLCVFISSLYIYIFGSKSEAMILAGGFLASGALIAALKITFLGCLATAPGLALHSPSGHAAMSASTLTIGAILIIRNQTGRIFKFLTGLIAGAMTVAIAISRVILQYHTPAEVIVGLTAGLAVAAVASIGLRRVTRRPLHWKPLVPIMAVAILLTHGNRLPAEQFIRQIAQIVRQSVGTCASS